MMEHRHGDKTFKSIESRCGEYRRPVGCNCVAVSLLDVRAIAGIKHTAMACGRDTRKCERDLLAASLKIDLRAQARNAKVKRQPIYPCLRVEAVCQTAKKHRFRLAARKRVKGKPFEVCIGNSI